MLEDIPSAIPLAFLLAFMPGAVFFALLETSAIKGFRAAVALDLGVFLCDIIFLLIAYFMTSSILEKLKDDPGLYIFGGSALVIYGIISFLNTKKEYLKEMDPKLIIVKKNNYFSLFVKGFLLNFINIGVLGFWLGLIVLFSPQLENDSNRIVTFFGAVLITYFAIDLCKIVLAKSLNHYLTPHRIYLLKRLIAIIMLVCGAVLIFKGAFPDSTQIIGDYFQEVSDSQDVELETDTVQMKGFGKTPKLYPEN